MANKELGIADPVYDALRIRSGQSIAPDLGGGTTGGSGLENKIYVWHADGSAIDTFDADAAGLALAIAAAAAGDTIWLPSINIALTAAITIPANVTLVGISDQAELQFGSISGAALTLSAESVLDRLFVTQTANDAEDLFLVQGPASGTGYIGHCTLSCTQSGDGEAVALLANTGAIYVHDTKITGDSVNGGYAVKSGDGLTTLDDCWLVGSTGTIQSGGATYAPGSEISTGSITVNSSAGNTISGLSIGNWYCVESYDAYDRKPSVHSYTNEIMLSDDGGVTWSGRFGANSLLNAAADVGPSTGYSTNLPTFAILGEFWGPPETRPRIYFQATTTSIKIRVYDTFWTDNTGALSYRLRNATVTGSGTGINVITHGVRLDPVIGEPVQGDRSVWDTATYFDRHASDIHDETFTYHSDPDNPPLTLSTIAVTYNAYNEIQTGTGGTIYYLANEAEPDTVRIYINGIRQPAENGESASDVVTFSVAPDVGDTLIFDYELAVT